MCSHPDYPLAVDCRGEDLDGQLNRIAHDDKHRPREAWYALISDSFENGAIVCRTSRRDKNLEETLVPAATSTICEHGLHRWRCEEWAMPTLLQDLRDATRQLIRNLGLTIAAVISLALGIRRDGHTFPLMPVGRRHSRDPSFILNR